jgi:hypothetical protein
MLGGKGIMLAVDYCACRTAKSNEFNWLVTHKALPREIIHKRKYEQYLLDISKYRRTTRKLPECKVADPLLLKFKRLLAEWQEESIVMSSITEMVMLPSYQAIIGMGPDAVRLILNELKHDPDYLFWALEAITGANPVLPEDEGNLNRMTNAWIKWGQESGLT